MVVTWYKFCIRIYPKGAGRFNDEKVKPSQLWYNDVELNHESAAAIASVEIIIVSNIFNFESLKSIRGRLY